MPYKFNLTISIFTFKRSKGSVLDVVVYIVVTACNGFEWDTLEYALCHLYFPYTHEPLDECAYKKNSSNKWHFHGIP
mgnify:CR=1 FL=1